MLYALKLTQSHMHAHIDTNTTNTHTFTGGLGGCPRWEGQGLGVACMSHKHTLTQTTCNTQVACVAVLAGKDRVWVWHSGTAGSERLAPLTGTAERLQVRQDVGIPAGRVVRVCLSVWLPRQPSLDCFVHCALEGHLLVLLVTLQGGPLPLTLKCWAAGNWSACLCP